MDLKPTLKAYYLRLSTCDVIETNEGEYQRLELPNKSYGRALYLVPDAPQEFVEQEIEKQLQMIFKRMREENETN